MKFRFSLNFLILTTLSLLSEQTIHIIGDSHVGSFVTGGLNTNHQASYYPYPLNVPFVIHWIGPKLMHTFGKDESCVNLNQLNVKDEDICVFSFGEIDVRCHIGKQRDQQNRDLLEILETLTKNYIAMILKKKSAFQQLTCVVYNVVPPINVGPNPQYPYYGSLEDRIAITKQLNAMLKAECEKHSIYFLDVYDIYSTPDGRLNKDYSDGQVHIGSQHGGPIRNALIALLLKSLNS